jgi:hypothetical protein
MANARISIDPTVMMGKPCIKGTRITVEHILRKLGAGRSFADLREAHPQLTRGRPSRRIGVRGGLHAARDCACRRVMRFLADDRDFRLFVCDGLSGHHNLAPGAV